MMQKTPFAGGLSAEAIQRTLDKAKSITERKPDSSMWDPETEAPFARMASQLTSPANFAGEQKSPVQFLEWYADALSSRAKTPATEHQQQAINKLLDIIQLREQGVSQRHLLKQLGADPNWRIPGSE